MQKQDTIAATMRLFMEGGPSAIDFPTYKSLNDYVGAVHGLPAGKCQALAGAKAWAWAKDEVTGKWRKATEAEVKACEEKAAEKNNGGTRKARVLSDADRAALDAQVTALEAVNNPALAPLLADLLARRDADDLARKGSLKDQLADCVDKLGMARAIEALQKAIETLAAAAEAPAAEVVEAAENA